jgi:hypothetical protein
VQRFGKNEFMLGVCGLLFTMPFWMLGLAFLSEWAHSVETWKSTIAFVAIAIAYPCLIALIARVLRP